MGSAVLPEDALYLLGVSLATASAAAGATTGDSKDSEGDGDGAEPTEFQQAAIATVAESFGQLRVEDIGEAVGGTLLLCVTCVDCCGGCIQVTCRLQR